MSTRPRRKPESTRKSKTNFRDSITKVLGIPVAIVAIAAGVVGIISNIRSITDPPQLTGVVLDMANFPDGVTINIPENFEEIEGLITAYTYTIRFFYNNGTRPSGYLVRTFNHSEVDTPLTRANLFYTGNEDDPLIPDETELERSGLKRLAWSTVPFDDQQSIDIRPHPNNHFVPGITIREIFESGRFRTYVDGNAHFVHVYALWGSLPG